MIDEKDMPARGTVWKHYNGNVYVVLTLTNYPQINPRYEPQVVHVGRSGRVYSRALSDWRRSLSPVPTSEKAVHEALDAAIDFASTLDAALNVALMATAATRAER